MINNEIPSKQSSSAEFSKNLISNNELDLRKLFLVVWQGKITIIVITFMFVLSAIAYSLTLPNIYKSDILLAPASEDGALTIPGQLGGLAALAGVNLGAGANKVDLALEIIKSREFIGKFITKYDLFVPVMASKGWSRESNQLLLDDKVYRLESDEWIRDVGIPLSPKPSVLETHEQFMDLLEVSQHKVTGMVTLSVEHYSPYLAQQWATLLVKEINLEMRQRELTEAQNSIIYLNGLIETTNVSDVRTMLFSLIEEQTKTVMLANVREEYVLKTIDPAVVAEKKFKPARALIVILTLILGLLLSVFIVTFRYCAKNKL